MWLFIAILGTWAAAAAPATAALEDSTQPLKPVKTVGALGVTIQSNGRLSGIARLRWANAASVALAVGTSPGWRQTQADVGDFGSFDDVTATRSGHVAANLRWPIVANARQDLLWTLGVDGSIGRTRRTPRPGVQSIVTPEQIRQFRSASVYTGADLDHWLTPSCAVTVGVHAARAQIERIEDVADTTTNARDLGLSGRISLGVVGVL